MVEVMKIMSTSFKWSHACTATLSSPDSAASRFQLTSLPTHASTGDSWTLTRSLGQSLVGSLLLSPGSCCTQGFVCALQESVSSVLCKFWQLYGGINGDFLQEDLCHTPCLPGLLWPEPLSLQQVAADLYLHRRHLNTQRQVWLNILWSHCSFPQVLLRIRFCLCPQRISGGCGI